MVLGDLLLHRVEIVVRENKLGKLLKKKGVFRTR